MLIMPCLSVYRMAESAALTSTGRGAEGPSTAKVGSEQDMKPLRVLALVHDYLVPPDDVRGVDVVNAPWKTEFDVTNTLAAMGHKVYTAGIGNTIGTIADWANEIQPSIVFNLMEAFREIGTFDQNIVSHLELVQLQYTGCNPRGLILSRDKALTKTILASNGIPVPEFVILRRGHVVQQPTRLRFPLIVKSLTQDASFGIAQASIVTSERQFAERVAFVHDALHTDAIAEQYIDGRELYVGVIGNERLHAFPVWEMQFEKMPAGVHRIATARVKWSSDYQQKNGIRCGKARLSRRSREDIQSIAKQAFRCLQMNGYGRIDIRLDAEGRPWVLEANANPQLAYGEDFAESAHHDGVPYESLLQRILNVGLQWRAERGG